MAEKNGYFHALWMCVFVCQKKRAASCQRGGVKRPLGIWTLPSCRAHCLPRQWDIYLHLPIPPSLLLTTLTENLSAKREAPPLPPLLLSAHVRSLFLYRCAAFISHHLSSPILLTEECPPTSRPAEQPHCHQSATGLLWRGDWYPPHFLS